MHRHDTNEAGERTAGQCCHDDAGCEAGLRNNYYQGKLLTPDTFRVEQRYLVERRRLINRAIHGWGVVYGYAIEITARGLCVQPGFALDACGRELVQVGTRRIDLDQLVIVDDACKPIVDKSGRPISHETAFAAAQHACWLLRAHYAEQSLDGVRVADRCRCEHHEWDHTCETVRYTLTPVSCDEGCCADQACELACECRSGPCCEPDTDEPPPKRKPGAPPPPPKPSKPFSRGGCSCLCEHLIGLEPGADCDCALRTLDEPCGHGHVGVDLAHGIPIGCMKVEHDDTCNEWKIASVDACGPRRLVKRNDLLYDLIRGCDLTRISEIGWAKWHRNPERIPFDLFSQAFGPAGQNKEVYVSEDFWVKFSRPVRASTLQPDCFAMTVLATEREGGWWQVARVPIIAVQALAKPDEGGLVRLARIVVDGAWVEDGLRGRHTLFQGEETRIEIEVRGDFIVDCNGQTVDANAIGLAPDRTGNGTPGGSFISTFRVGSAREKSAYAPHSPVRDIEGAQS